MNIGAYQNESKWLGSSSNPFDEESCHDKKTRVRELKKLSWVEESLAKHIFKVY